MPIRFRHQDTAIFVTEPARDRFEIDSCLDRIGTEEMSQSVMSVSRQTRTTTR